MLRASLLAFLAIFASSTQAGEQRLITLFDPAGDDNGNGALVYSSGGELRRGDLDLRSLDVTRDEAGFWFTATFGNPIREKWWVPAIDSRPVSSSRTVGTPEPLLFNFNIDLYIDMDRDAGAGQMFTLPGRGARIDPHFAWERVVVVSPQPKAMRAHLLEKLEKNFPNRPVGEAEASIDATMYFASNIRINGNDLSVFVPKAFFLGSDGSDWAVTTLVTAASPTMDESNLGVMQVGKTPSADTLGYSSERPPPPIVDMLLPTVEQQHQLLASAAALAGVDWKVTTGNEALHATYVKNFKERLTILQELLDQGLIDTHDYGTERARILSEF